MSDKTKLAVAAALVIALALWWWLGGLSLERKEGRSFRASFPPVDTGAIRTFRLTTVPGAGRATIQFQRDQEGWVASQDGHSVRAYQRPINELFTALANLRPEAVAGTGAQVLRQYAITDSLAGLFRSPQVFNGQELRVGNTTEPLAEPTLDAPPPATAVRVQGDPHVYLVEYMFNHVFRMELADWLTKPMLNGDPSQWERITFVFPGSTGYSIERQNGKWLVAGQPADTLKVERYLRALSKYHGTALANPADTAHALLTYSIMVEKRDHARPMLLGIFRAGNNWIARSTLAPPWLVMAIDPEVEIPRMFRPPTAFMPD